MNQINWKKISLIVTGFLALCWFLIRVIPKPSRATYPCQQAAFPIASAFVIWLTGFFGSAFFFVRMKRSLKDQKVVITAAFIVLFSISFLIFTSAINTNNSFARNPSNYQKAIWDGSERIAGLSDYTITDFEEVAVVKSSKANAKDIEFEEIESMVREAVEMAGGIEDIITNGDYVVLKPNLVVLPENQIPDYVEVSGMTTDWRVTRVVAKMVRELNPGGKIYIIESSAENSTRATLNYYNYTLENIPEVDQIVALEDSCGAFEDYNDPNLDKVFLDDEIRLYPDEEKPNNSPEFYIAKIYNNADVVISIPVLKNHSDAVMTGGVKNVALGMAPPNIYGMSATFFGKWTKINHSQATIYNWLHDFYLIKPVDFVVVDGLQGFSHGPAGNGNLSMEEMQENMRLIISGKKALSVDAVCSNIMSHDPTYANYLVYLDKEEYGVGTINSKFIRIKGERMADIRKIFSHTSPVTIQAVYFDDEPPAINVNSTSVDGNTITLDIESDDDVDKIQLKVDDVLLDQICVADFSNSSFEVSEDLLPFESLTVIASDRFFNETSTVLDYSDINEVGNPSAVLYQNYPNPANGQTTISYQLLQNGHVVIELSALNGQQAKVLYNGNQNEGLHRLNIETNDLKSGIYIYTLKTEGKSFIRRMIVQN